MESDDKFLIGVTSVAEVYYSADQRWWLGEMGEMPPPILWQPLPEPPLHPLT